MSKIRGREDLTAARDQLVAEWEGVLAQLKAAKTVKDLDAIIWSRAYQRVTDAVADLANAVEGTEHSSSTSK